MRNYVEMPKMDISINRDEYGNYVLESPLRGKIITESQTTALEILKEWFEHQDGVFKELKEQFPRQEFYALNWKDGVQ